ncbi:Feather keratin 4, partial [Anas platyrhynchos]
MSCSSLFAPVCGVAAPAPLADSANEPCVRQCPDSTVVIQPPATVLTLPGPILSSFPQHAVAPNPLSVIVHPTAVGSTTSAAVGSILSAEGVPISSGGFGLSGFGGRYYGRRCLP